MYAEYRIREKLKAAQINLGWMPEYHSVDEVEIFNRKLKQLEITEPNGDICLARNLYDNEMRWIRNERALAFSDAMYFKTRYCYLTQKNEFIRYSPRKSQMVFNRVLADLDEKGHSIEIQALKARQQGISTEVELDFAHRIITIPGTQAIIASANGQKSELMARMFYTVLDMLPWWLKPRLKKDRRGPQGMLEFYTQSIFAVQSGTQNSGIAQGWTPTLAHVSEVCDYPNPVVTIEEGLLKCAHTSSALFIVLESTGNGNEGWWAETWRSSKEHYWSGEARLLPLFIPWHMASDLFPDPDWLDKYRMPTDWRPGPETIKHATKCAAYVRNTPTLSNILGMKWDLPREQMWFWEFNFNEHKRKHIAKSWLRQMPADDLEALSGKTDTIFGVETIEVVTQRRETNYEVFGIAGDGIDDEQEPLPEEVDYSKESFYANFTTRKDESLSWMFLPMRPIDERDEDTAMNKLLVFERPIQGCDYTLAIDTGRGLGQDRTALQMLRRGADDAPDVQVAEFCSDRINAPQAVGYAAAMCSWYGPSVPQYKMPLIVIEQTRKPGDDCQLQMVRLGFSRHYRWQRFEGKDPQREDRNSRRFGWYTNAWSREFMFGRIMDAVENGWIIVNSIFAIRELAGWRSGISRAGKSRIDHEAGKHDDRAFPLGFGYVASHKLDVMLERMKKRYDLPQNSLPELDEREYNPFQVAVSMKDESLFALM